MKIYIFIVLDFNYLFSNIIMTKKKKKMHPLMKIYIFTGFLNFDNQGLTILV